MLGSRCFGAWLVVLAMCGATASRADELITLPTRSGVTVSYWYMPRANAAATLVLLPGGAGGIGLRDGRSQSGNFLVRSRDLFAAESFNVAIVGRPSDVADMDTGFRAGAAHMQDLGRVVDDLLERTNAPLWLVGTSAPHEVPLILSGLTQAPVKKLLWASGGDGARGDPCEAFHWHGYIGMEAQAVPWITAWVRHPEP